MRLPRLLVAATASGAGKTSLFLGLLEAFRRRGLDLRAFKAGPDYLDPALHAAVLGAPSRNLDARLMGGGAVRACLGSRRADLALVEGSMGYFDGGHNSNADLARHLGLPVILVLDAEASAESLAAVALGFQRYRRGCRITGFVANRIAGEGHYALVRKAVEARTGLPLLGFLPRDAALSLPSRHLGLVSPGEGGDFRKVVRNLGDAVASSIDLELMLDLAAGAAELPEALPAAAPGPGGRVRIAVARDEAFSFYYEDNLDTLEGLGAELAFFSPLRDAGLPEGSAALYLGGGYPELHLDQIAANASMREAIRAARRAGMPIYAECGGYLYLLEALEDPEGRRSPALGLLPGLGRPGRRLAALGYREGLSLGASPLGRRGIRLRGHVFHYYRVEEGGGRPSIALARPGAGAAEALPEGYADPGLFASFLHVHFSANRAAASAFVASARAFAGKGAETDA